MICKIQMSDYPSTGKVRFNRTIFKNGSFLRVSGPKKMQGRPFRPSFGSPQDGRSAS
jgi:hypothetical protein